MKKQQLRDVLMFMAWLDCDSLQSLAEIPQTEITYSINRFRDRLLYVGIEKDPNRIIDNIEKFYQDNNRITN